jgi:hypothetical protein
MKGDFMNDEFLELVRTANREFQEFIGQTSQKGTKAIESRGAIRRLEKISLRLEQVSHYLTRGYRSLAEMGEAAYEIQKYRDNLKTLGPVIETLQFSLLAEKAHLEQVRGNLQAASAWATSLREIS